MRSYQPLFAIKVMNPSDTESLIARTKVKKAFPVGQKLYCAGISAETLQFKFGLYAYVNDS